MKINQLKKQKKQEYRKMDQTVSKPKGTNVNKPVSRQQGNRRKKNEWVVGAGLVAYMISFLVRIPLSHIIGDRGLGFLAGGFELFTVLTVILSYGMSRSVAILVRYRTRREMYKSINRLLRTAMFLTIFTGGIISAAVFFFSEQIAKTVLLEHLSYLSMAAAAPAIFLSAVMGVLKGYFQGMGTMVPTTHSKLLEKILMFGASLICGYIFYAYGQKVAALLKNENAAYAYGAMGAAVGLTIACLFGVLHLIFIKMVYAGTFKQQLAKDTGKYSESGAHTIVMLITTGLPYTISALLFQMNYLVDQRLFNAAAGSKAAVGTRVLHWGTYYGKYSAVIGTAAILCTLGGAAAIQTVVQALERHEHREVQERLGRAVHYTAIVSIPCAVIIAALAEPIVKTLFQGNPDLAVQLIQAGSVVIVLFAFTFLFMGILQRIRKMKLVIAGGLAAFVIHLAVVIFLLNTTKLGISAVVIGSISFYFTACLIAFLSVQKCTQYSQEWIRTFGITAVAAGVSGLVGMLLGKVLLSPLGSIVTLAICVPLCIIIYLLLLIILRGVHADELEEMPGGKVIAALAQKMHFM